MVRQQADGPQDLQTWPMPSFARKSALFLPAFSEAEGTTIDAKIQEVVFVPLPQDLLPPTQSKSAVVDTVGVTLIYEDTRKAPSQAGLNQLILG